MFLGMSSYSFSKSIAAGGIDILGVIDWIAKSGADHLEVAAAGLGADLLTDPDLVDAIAQRARERGVPLSNYAVAADFRGEDRAEQIERLKAQIGVAERLGITRIRHDVVAWSWQENDRAELEDAYERIVPACQEIADHAGERGITTTVENHGMCMNNSERLARLVHLVDRPNFGLTADIGNSLCVDEQPIAAVPQNIRNAVVVHLKDFYIRTAKPGPGWLRTPGGNYLRGAVLGFGDMDIRRTVRVIRKSGYDGPMAIEFEGAEDPFVAADIALENARRFWDEAA